MAVDISPATRDDLPGVTMLMKQQLDEHNAVLAPEALRAALDAVIQDERLGFLLVARTDCGIVGCAYVSFVWALEHAGKSAWLEELYVNTAFRGRGIGSALLEEAIRLAAAAHCAAIDLEVDEAHTDIIGMYSRRGFVNLGRRRFARKLTG